ncbi:uncharacterized protein A4U43_C04F35170 [Asparagus officinalis]|uniref:U1-type domain-containing protein n=1 Tax=Asparagus officinalis TaxID=4686 RepID=A0A5P1F5Y4_ASPOF|nr:uncharacterized protein LOC109839633 [Asparagus officinalis]ONK73768.1 uncharacterized protein A4U43_C04F35170 [Asparagus officinalis]
MQQAPAVHARGRVAWCDICRVDCNSWDILEQHKNGKKHKKTLLRLAEFERQQKLYPELQAEPMPVAMLPNAVTDKAAEVVSVAPENIMIAAASTVVESEVTHTPSVAQVDDTSKTFNPEESKPIQQGLELEVQAAGQEQVTEGSRGPLRSDGHSQFDTRRGGMKRKSNKSGRGGKRLKSFEPARARAPQRQKDRPRFCTICNVLCESLVVFDAHVAGKKHLSKLKRFQGQGTVFGPITIYIPPNQPSPYPKQGPEPLYFGLTSQEMLQHESYRGLNGFQAESYGFHQGEVNPDNRNNEAVLGDNPENQATAAADAPLVFESKEPPQLPTEPEVANSEADALSRAEFGTLPEDDPALSGLDAKMEQPGAES